MDVENRAIQKISNQNVNFPCQLEVTTYLTDESRSFVLELCSCKPNSKINYFKSRLNRLKMVITIKLG
jgi:hypothetical protein